MNWNASEETCCAMMKELTGIDYGKISEIVKLSRSNKKEAIKQVKLLEDYSNLHEAFAKIQESKSLRLQSSLYLIQEVRDVSDTLLEHLRRSTSGLIHQERPESYKMAIEDLDRAKAAFTELEKIMSSDIQR